MPCSGPAPASRAEARRETFPLGILEKIAWPRGGALAAFVPRTGELTVFTKARGLGDCGSYVRYAFPATGPKRVQVVEARVKGCSDRPPQETVITPDTWPLVKKP